MLEGTQYVQTLGPFEDNDKKLNFSNVLADFPLQSVTLPESSFLLEGMVDKDVEYFVWKKPLFDVSVDCTILLTNIPISQSIQFNLSLNHFIYINYMSFSLPFAFNKLFEKLT